MNVRSRISSPNKEKKIEEVILSNKYTRCKEHYRNCRDIIQKEYRKSKYSNVIIGSVVTEQSKFYKNKNKKRVRFCDNLVEYVDIISYKDFNRENYFQPQVEVITTDTSCKQECRILTTKCFIF